MRYWNMRKTQLILVYVVYEALYVMFDYKRNYISTLLESFSYYENDFVYLSDDGVSMPIF